MSSSLDGNDPPSSATVDFTPPSGFGFLVVDLPLQYDSPLTVVQEKICLRKFITQTVTTMMFIVIPVLMPLAITPGVSIGGVITRRLLSLL